MKTARSACVFALCALACGGPTDSAPETPEPRPEESLPGGATTNTPSLAAANQALREHPVDAGIARSTLEHVAPGQSAGIEDEGLRQELAKLPGLGYAVAYPFGTVGAILVLILLRAWFRIDLRGEGDALQRESLRSAPPLDRLNLRVTNPNLAGRTMPDIERQAILDTLRACRGNKAAAARSLGLCEKTIYNKLRKLWS